MSTIALRPIGVIRSPFTEPRGAPIQPAFAGDTRGEVVLDEEFQEALADIEGFERIWLVCWLHRAGPFAPVVVPYRDTIAHGVLATRAPARPNPIGLSAVRLLGREGRILHVAGIDMLDGTPLLDLKPYVPAYDAHESSRAGWLDEGRADRRVADGRFHGGQPEPGR